MSPIEFILDIIDGQRGDWKKWIAVASILGGCAAFSWPLAFIVLGVGILIWCEPEPNGGE